MRFLSLTQASLLGVLFAHASWAFARSEEVLCPTANFVSTKADHLDTVHALLNNAYQVYSNSETILDERSKRYWSISTTVQAEDFKEAFTNARQTVESVSVKWDKYAKKFDNFHCKYSAKDVNRVVFLTASNQEGMRLSRQWR